MDTGVPRAVIRIVCRRLRHGLWRGLVWLAQAVGFVAGLLDELVTAWVGCAPVLPRLRRWRRHLVVEWHAYRAGAIEGEVMDGVWR